MLVIKYWIIKYIIKMNKKQNSKYLLGFREISMGEAGFYNKFSPPEN